MHRPGRPSSRWLVVRSATALSLVAAAVRPGAHRGRARASIPTTRIWRDPETQNAARVKPIDLSDRYDALENSFLGAGERARSARRQRQHARRGARLDLVHQPHRADADERRGSRPGRPDTGTGPAAGQWTIVGGKTEGVQPGLTIRDTAGQIYFVKFDPPSNPEMASAAEVIATKFLYAAGYHVPGELPRHDPSRGAGDRRPRPGPRRRQAAGDASMGRRRRCWRSRRATPTAATACSPAGRSTANPVGPFRYYGTRPDDPNDIFPHEHRRELRGLGVLAAWLNHDDSRAPNTLDTLVTSEGRTVVRHHLIDFGSTLGSGSTRSQSTQAGNEFLWESRPTLITMLTLGFYVRPWIKVAYPDLPSVGRFESSYFEPEAWKPVYANPAFANARADDRFWGARLVAAFSDDAIRAIVATGRYSDPRATGYVTDTLIARRRKILASWLAGPNPLVDPRLDASGQLTFRNAAEQAGVGPAAESYTVEWAAFDNASDSRQGVTMERSATAAMRAPAALLAGGHQFLSARVGAIHPDHPAWAKPITFFFRRDGAAWEAGRGRGALVHRRRERLDGCTVPDLEDSLVSGFMLQTEAQWTALGHLRCGCWGMMMQGFDRGAGRAAHAGRVARRPGVRPALRAALRRSRRWRPSRWWPPRSSASRSADSSSALALDFSEPGEPHLGARRQRQDRRRAGGERPRDAAGRRAGHGANEVRLAFRPATRSLNRNADFLYTLFVPARAHAGVSLLRSAGSKARWTLALDVPAGWQAVANGAETVARRSRRTRQR